MHRVHGRFYRGAIITAVMLLVIGGAVAGGVGLWQGSAIAGVFRDRAVWARGVQADGGRVSGHKTTHALVLHDYELEVHYTDRAGAEHTASASFAVLFGSPEDDNPVLRFDPAAPEQFAVSWAVDAWIPRLITAAIMLLPALAVGGVLIVGCFLMLAGMVRRGRALAAGTWTSLDGKDGSAWPKGGEPLWADAKATRILAVSVVGHDGKDEVVPLRADGYPLRLSPEEIAAACAHLAQRT